ncbi:methyl-accepting chemotaxis protein [Sphingomonas sp. PAMC 26621]|uniref:methyl-accepting chemotaxis protein n=1 Tax=Sphingomonas sp. PAMC 26621 TaxID=1112213 RepID=UPI0002897A24|nr:methyl-accepting chemotaxis protein [Sphingomonas sp. PAMC 26621]
MNNILASLKISTKILILLLALGAVTIIISLSTSSSLTRADDANTAMVSEAKAPVYIARSTRKIEAMQLSAYRAMAYDGASAQARGASVSEQEDYDTAVGLLAKAAQAAPALKDQIDNVHRQYDALHTMLKPAVLLGLANKDDQAMAILTKADLLAATVIKQAVALNDETIARGDAKAAALTVSAKSTTFWLLALSLTGVVISVVGGLVVSRIGITGPLARLKATMEALAGGNNAVAVDGTGRRDEVGDMAKVVLVFRETAVAKASADAEKVEADKIVQMVVKTLGTSLSDLSNRDLTTHVDAEYPGLYAELKDNYNEAIGSVRTTIEQVSESARSISTGANEIAQASEDLARRTESNAASLEETSAALSQMESRLKGTATASQSTVARADQAMVTVGRGRSTADTAMQAMGRVSDSAKGIDGVIEGLDKIAFQTRVLAMNAAVEAGRAGDAGRGFAVVADLVSALAMRAEEEAKRARDQLSITQLEIVTAVDAVGRVDTALAAISSDVGEVNHLLAGMAFDNQAQSSTITEITAAVSMMDQATQQNAAMVEETSAAARNLTHEVATLAQAAAQFNVEGGARNPAIEVGSLSDQASGLKVVQNGSRRPMQAARKPNYANPASYTSPIKPLPGAAILAIVRPDSEDWNSF